MTKNCFEDTKFFIPPCSDQFPVLARKIVLAGGSIVSKVDAADICIAPEGTGIRVRGWYHPTLVNESIKLGNVPCLCRFDTSTDQPKTWPSREKRPRIFEGLQFWYPPVAFDYSHMKYKIEVNGGILNACSESDCIRLVPRGWIVYDDEEYISYEYIDHCIEIGEVDCFCGFEV